MPNHCFYAREDVVARMLRQNDAAVMSGFVGFPSRPVPDDWRWSDAAF
jgi:hypothetical protein